MNIERILPKISKPTIVDLHSRATFNMYRMGKFEGSKWLKIFVLTHLIMHPAPSSSIINNYYGGVKFWQRLNTSSNSPKHNQERYLRNQDLTSNVMVLTRNLSLYKRTSRFPKATRTKYENGVICTKACIYVEHTSLEILELVVH